MYKTMTTDVPPEKTKMQSSINQLDTLLDDLQQVKKSSYSERGKKNFTINCCYLLKNLEISNKIYLHQTIYDTFFNLQVHTF